MKSPIRIDRNNHQIIINSSFAKMADIYNTQEYAMLQQCRRDYPDFTVITRTIKTNPDKEGYKGLTYEYMENYIRFHSPNSKEDLDQFNEMKFIAKCHSRRYPIIKEWFLNKYPEVKMFGMSALAAFPELLTLSTEPLKIEEKIPA